MPPGAAPLAPPPPAKDSGGMKLLGGCGIAGCLGVMVAVGLVVVLIVFFGLFGEPSSSGAPSSGTTGTDDGTSSVPESGSLRSLLKQDVGGYSLAGTSPIKEVPAGVVDNIGAVYVSSGGTKVVHLLYAFSTKSGASNAIQNLWTSSLAKRKSGQKIERKTVYDKQQAVIGVRVSVTGGGYDEEVYWTNNKVLCVAMGPPPDPTTFEKLLTY